MSSIEQAKAEYLPPGGQLVQHTVAGQEHEHTMRHNFAHLHHALAHAVLEGNAVGVLEGGLQFGPIWSTTYGPCPDLLAGVHNVRSFQLDGE